MNSSLITANATLETKLTEVTGKLESSVITNQKLVAECISIKKRYDESEKHLIDVSRSQDRTGRWVNSHKIMIEDYERYSSFYSQKMHRYFRT